MGFKTMTYILSSNEILVTVKSLICCPITSGSYFLTFFIFVIKNSKQLPHQILVMKEYKLLYDNASTTYACFER